MKRTNQFVPSANYSKYKRNKVESCTVQKVILDQNSDEAISIDDSLVERLKPHQINGIRFMWESCFQSAEKLTESIGGGCILAHCMGVGMI